jgi:hypothetical protein
MQRHEKALADPGHQRTVRACDDGVVAGGADACGGGGSEGEMLAGLVLSGLATVVAETRSELVLTWAQRFMRSQGVFLSLPRIAAVEGPLGPTIQIFDDDVVAFTRLIDLTLLLISTTFPYLCDCRLGGAEAYHADGNCHSNECNSDAAQSLLPDVHGLSVHGLILLSHKEEYLIEITWFSRNESFLKNPIISTTSSNH